MMLNKSTVLCAGVAVMLSVTAVLADGEKPSITSQPYSQTVTVGVPVTFSVTATGEEPLSYQWNKDGTAINSATNSTYTINSVQTFDEGSYTVKVTNAVDSVTSETAVLTVKSAPSYTEGLEYRYNSDGTATVTDIGTASEVADIIIPGTIVKDETIYTVTSIKFNALNWCDNLETITIPASMISIEAGALRGCSKLTGIYVNSDNSNYSSVEGILFNKEQTVLVQYPCGREGDYIIPEGVTEIGEMAFYYCSKLTSVTLNDGLETISNLAFYNCGIQPSIVIPDSVTTIGSSAFRDCYRLVNIAIGSGVSSIESDTFGGNRLNSFTVSPENQYYSSEGNVLFNKDKTLLIKSFSNGNTYVIPEGVTEIGNSAFSGSNLTSITIPDSVITIGTSAFHNIGLTSVVIPDSVVTLGDKVFYACYNITNIVVGSSVETIGQEALYCRSLISIYFKGDAPETGANVLWNADQSTVYYFNGAAGWTDPWCDRPTVELDGVLIATQPHSEIALMGDTATFSVAAMAYGDLSYQWYKDGVAIVGATGSTYTLNNVQMADAGIYTAIVSISTNSVTSDEAILTVIDSTPTGDPAEDFEYEIYDGEVTITGYVGSNEVVTIPNIIEGCLVKTLGNSSFRNNNILRKVIIPDTVTTIQDWVFADSQNLESIELPESVETIKTWAFAGCKKLTTMVIPDSVTSVGSYAFFNCSGLTSIIIGTGVTNFADTFGLCPNLRSIYFRGNAPAANNIEANATVYYYEGTTGWTNPWCGRPTAELTLAPTIKAQPKSQTAYVTATATIGVTAIGFGELSYQWYKDGSAIVGATANTYTIEDANFDDEGSYTVTVSNEYGSVTSDGAVLTVKVFEPLELLLDFQFNEGEGLISSSSVGNAVLNFENTGNQLAWSTRTPARDADLSLTNDFSVYVDNQDTSMGVTHGTFNCDAIDFWDTSDASFTLETWIKGASRSSMKQVFFQTWSSTTGRCPRLSFAIGADCTICLTTLGVSDIYTYVSIPEDGGWHHIACAFDQPNSILYTYVDGELANEKYLYNANVDFGTRSGIYENVGTIGSEYSGYAPFTGCLDRVRLWRGVLPQDQLDYVKYNPVIKDVILKWEQPSIIAYGTPLSDKQLNAVAVNGEGEYVDGVYNYEPSWGEILPEGVHTLTVTFTPNDPLYVPATKSVRAEVMIPGLAYYCDWDGTATVTGIGTLFDETEIEIPETIERNGEIYTVTYIGYSAFAWCDRLTSVTIPDSVIYIDGEAFRGCENLREIIIPDSVTNIEWAAFMDCASLETLVISENCTYISGSAFERCYALTEVNIPDSVTQINGSAFRSCSGLVHVVIGDGLTSIDGYVFDQCSNLEWVEIGQGVNMIQDRAFGGCSNLKVVYFTGNAPEMCSDSAFDGTQATLYYMAGSEGWTDPWYGMATVEIDGFAIAEQPHSQFALEGKAVTFSVGTMGIDDLSYQWYKDGITIDGATDSSYTINSVQSSDEGSYMVVVSSADKSVSSDEAVLTMLIPTGDPAEDFEYTISGGAVTIIGYVGANTVVNIPNVIEECIVRSIGDSAFRWSSLTSVTIPDTVTSIGYLGFENSRSLTELNLGNSLTTIGGHAFQNCTRLETVIIPASLTSLGDNSFEGCNALTSVYFEGNAPTTGYNVFLSAYQSTIYYFSGRTGWTDPWCNRPTVEIDGLAITEQPQSQIAHIGSTVNFSVEAMALGELSYQWYKDGEAIAGATSSRYMINNAYTTDAGIYTVTVSNAEVNMTSDEAVLEVLENEVGDVVTVGYLQYTILSEDTVNVSGYESGIESDLVIESVIVLGDQSYSVVEIGDSAFYDCQKLVEVTIPASVTSIGNDAFNECDRLTEITIPEGVTSIGSWAFANSDRLTKAAILGNVTSMGEYVFANCYDLAEVTISDNATMIGNNMFISCYALTEITIPASMTTIGESAFSDCRNLTEITVSADNEKYTSVDGVVFNKEQTELVLYPAGKEGAYIIPDCVTTIGNHAFDACQKLTGITIPVGVTSIDDYAFVWCSSLTQVTIPDSVTTIGNHAFDACQNLIEVAISESVTSIGSYAFGWCANLTNVTIPNSVTSIGNYVFNDCTALTAVTIGSGLTALPYGMFYNCQKLAMVTIPEGVTSIGTYAFSWCTSLTNVTIPNSVTSIGNYAFQRCQNLTDVTLSSGLTRIGSGVFQNCSSLTSIEIPGGVTTIGNEAFRGCTNLKGMIMPDSITSINWAAFMDCASLENLVISSNCTYISGSAFERCYALTEVNIPDSVTQIDGSAFRSCSGLVRVVIGNGLTSIDGYVFDQCSNLEWVEIGQGVNMIQDRAFGGCSNLTEIRFTGNAPEDCSDSAFDDVQATLYYITGTTGWTDPWNGMATVAVDLDTPVIITQPTSEVVLTEDSVSFTVAAIGSADLSYQWYKDGVAIVGATGSTYTLNNVQMADAGIYTAIVSISTNSVTSDEAILTVIDSTPTGDPAEDFEYEIYDGEVTITGYVGSNEVVTIPNIIEGCLVKTLGNSSFRNNNILRKVIIPDTVTTIQDWVFADSQNLESIELPESVETIKTWAFAGCKKLTTMVIPDSVTSVGSYAFFNCSGLTSIIIGTGVTNFADTFGLCPNLRSIYFRGNAPAANNIEANATVYYFSGRTGWTDPWCGRPAVEIDGILIMAQPQSETVLEEDTVTFSVTALSVGEQTYQWNKDGEAIAGANGSSYTIVNVQMSDAGSYTVTVNDGVNSVTSDEAILTVIDSTPTGDPAEDFEYEIYDGEVTITGYLGNNEVVTIPNIIEGCLVRTLGNYLFRYNDRLTKVVIPNTVKTLRNWVFADCANLNDVTIPDSVTAIGEHPFIRCYSLVEITLPDSLTSIGYGAFDSCTNLETVNIGNNVTAIDGYAFYNCRNLTEIELPAKVASIDSYAFNSCTSLVNIEVSDDNMTYSSVDGVLFNKDQTKLILCPAGKAGEYDIPNGTLSIEYSAFKDCSRLTAVTIPATVTSIGSEAFRSCSSLTEIIIPDSVTRINWAAFMDCASLENLVISSNCTYISGSVFERCYALTEVNIPDSVTQIDGSTFRSCSGLVRVVIGNGLTSIDGYVFDQCSNLEWVEIGNGVNMIQDRAFGGCSNLKVVYFTGNAPEMCSDSAFDGTQATLYYMPGAEGWTDPWYGMPTVEIDGVVIMIHPQSELVLEEDSITFNVIAMGNGELTYQWNKDGIVIDGATSTTYTIDSVQMSDAGSYTVTVNNEDISVTSNEAILTVIDSTPTGDPAEDFEYRISGEEVTITGYLGNKEVVTIPNIIEGYLVRALGNYSFAYNWDIINIIIPDTVISVGNCAFKECGNLNSITIGSSVASYLGNVSDDIVFWPDDVVFGGCVSLTNITVSANNANYSSVDGVLYNKEQTELIVFPAGKAGEFIVPDGVVSIARNAFQDCDKVTSVELSDTVTTIEDRAFRWCNNLVSVLIPGSVTSIGSYAFIGCTALENVMIGSGVTSIEECAFEGCTALTEITIPASVTSIWTAFYSCSNLTKAKFEGDAPECDDYVFERTQAVIYYNEGTSGWTNPWHGRPALTEGEVAIVTQPQSQTVVVGNPVTFDVTIAGIGEFSYQWYKDGDAIVGATEATFAIGAVSAEDAGSYAVTVSNTDNSITSDEAVLTVRVPKQPQLLLDFQFNEGEGLTSASSVGSAVLKLGDEKGSTDDPFGSVESPSGADGDLAAEFNGIGWAIGTFDDEPIDLTQPVTWEAWINVDAERVGSYEDYFRLANTFKIGADQYHRFEVTLCGIVDITSDEIEMTAGAGWTHVAAVWEPGVGVTFFQDGIEKDKVTVSSYANDYRSNILSVGSDHSGASNFKGKIDRMRIYNRVLTDTELDFDAANPKPIGDAVLAWDFDNETLPFVGTGSNAVDLTSGIDSRANDRTIEWSTSTPARDFDPSLTDDFSVFINNRNSNNSRYGIFNCDAIDFGDTSDASFTMEAWVKGASSHYMKQVVFQTWSSSNGKCPRLSFAINSDCSVLLTTLGVADIYTDAYIPEDGGWHHIACAFDQLNKKLLVYVDGELASNIDLYDANVNFATSGSDSNVGTIGAEHSGYAPFTGNVDRIRLWSGVLSQDQLDYVDYRSVLKDVVLTWDPMSPIVYGTPLSEDQLNAIATGPDGEVVAGTFTYTPSFGTILFAGVHELRVTFTPEDSGYEAAAASVELIVDMAVPTIVWDNPGEISYGTPLSANQLNATADVSGSFTYDPGFGTVLAVGTHTLNAVFEPYNVNYTMATASVTIEVTPAVGGLSYTYNSDGTATVIGIGTLSAETEIIIPKTTTKSGKSYTVTSIGEEAFAGCSGLESVTIPATVTSIGNNAFAWCSGLTSITIPNGVTTIGQEAFIGCNGLTSIAIPSTVTEIKNGTFCDCGNLTKVTISRGAVSIGNWAFESCVNLTSITIPNSVKSVGASAFAMCSSLTVITIPNSVTVIGGGAFAECIGLTEVTIPDSVTEFGNRVFSGCTNLTSVTIGSGVTSYLGNVSYDMIWWPTDVAFGECPNLTNITVSVDNPFYSSVDGVLFNKDQTELMVFPAGKEGEFVVPDGVITIAGAAFQDCDKVTSVVIPDSVTTIENWAFRWCDSLASVVIGNSVTSIGDYAFCYCPALADVTIGDGVTSIGYESFEGCSALTEITIPASVTSIASDAFYGCSNLTKVIFEGDAPECSEYTFDETQATIYYREGTNGWTNPWCGRETVLLLPEMLIDGIIYNYSTMAGEAIVAGYEGTPTDVVILATITADSVEYPVTTIADGAFQGCTSLRSVALPDSIVSIGAAAFQSCSGLVEITIPESVKFLGEGAFANCINLETVKIGIEPDVQNAAFDENETVTVKAAANEPGLAIGDAAFLGDDKLKTVHLGENVEKIGNNTFSGCESIEKITIPDSVTEVGNSAFEGCTNLETVNIGENVETIGSGAFSGCESITEVKIPDSVTSLGDSAFQNCSNLTTVEIGNNVETVGEAAFQNCANLTTVTMGENVSSIDSTALSGCDSLSSVAFMGETVPEGVTEALAEAKSTQSEQTELTVYYSDTPEWAEAKSGIQDATKTEPVQSTTDEVVITEVNVNGKPNGDEVDKGATVTFTVVAEGTGLFYQWYKDGTPIPSATASVFEIGSAALSDAGEYYAVVKNLGDSATSNSLTLEVDPLVGDLMTIGKLTYRIESLDKSKKTGTVSVVGYVGTLSGTLNIPHTWSSEFRTSEFTLSGYTYEVVAIEAETFTGSGCASLKAINICSGVESIGASAFDGCSMLKSITVDPANSVYSSVDGVLFDKTQTTLLLCPAGYAESDYIIPDGVTTLFDSAFQNCTNLESVTVPATVNSVGSGVFAGTALLSVTLDSEFVVDNFKGIFNDGDGITSVTIGSSVTAIASDTFRACSDLVEITISDSVTAIGAWVFADCSSLTSIVIPDSVVSMGEHPFIRCSQLSDVTLGSGLTSIGYGAFDSCSSLEAITIPDGITSIDGYAFYNCNGLTSITVPATVASVGDCAFAQCENLTSVYYEGDCPNAPSSWYIYNDASDELVSYCEPEHIASWEAAVVDGLWQGKPLVCFPAITEQPESQEVKAGMAVTFKVAAIGFPLNYQWYRNGIAIENATDSTYAIAETTTKHAGRYTVKVSNAGGSETSEAAVLTVLVDSKKYPIISWRPASLEYGERLGDDQLNAIALDEDGEEVEGTYVYTPVKGTALGVGRHTLFMTFTPEDQALYYRVSASTTIDVDKADQTITLVVPKTVYVGKSDQFSAVSTSGLMVTVVSSDPSILSVDGNVLNALTEGTVTITATQAGNDNYNAADPVTQTVIATKQINVTITVQSETITYGEEAPKYTYTMEPKVEDVKVDLSCVYAKDDNAGTYPIIATVTAGDKYIVETTNGTLTVEQAKPEVTIGEEGPTSELPMVAITYGTLLTDELANAEANVEGSFTYEVGRYNDEGKIDVLDIDPTEELVPAGEYLLRAAFTPTDSVNYTETYIIALYIVEQFVPTVTVKDAAFEYGILITDEDLTAIVTGIAEESVEGSFEFYVNGIALSQIRQPLTVRAYPLTVKFISADPNYADAESEEAATLIIGQANVVIVKWQPKAKIPYGDSIALDAVATVNGQTIASGKKLKYSVKYKGEVYPLVEGEILPIGEYDVRAEYIPPLGAGYAGNGTEWLSVTVTQLTPELLWDPAPMNYGDTPTEAQMNAEANVEGKFEYPEMSGLDAGEYLLTAKFIPDDPNYAVSTVKATLVVNPITPVLTWNPAPMNYGDAPTAAQMNAEANVEGKFEYPKMRGLDAGEYLLTAKFIPDDPNYAVSTVKAILVVNPIAPVITWTTPAPITDDTALSDAQLNATANVEGAFVYDPKAGTYLEAGTHTLTAVFTPTSMNYTQAAASVKLEVESSIEVEVTWETPEPIDYGTPLSEAQLNATANVEGRYFYNPTKGTVLSGGVHKLTVTFKPTNKKYGTLYKDVDLVVNKLEQTIEFEPIGEVVLGDVFALNASTDQQLPVRFESSDEEIVAIEGNIATAVRAGIVTITAIQDGNENYEAVSAEQTLVIEGELDFDFIGDVNYNGSATGSITAGTVEGSYTMKGSGADVWGDNDQFFYAANKVNGDFDYTVCVENFDGTSNAWAKAGIMVREADADDGQIGNARRFALQVQTESGKSGSSSDYWASWRDAVGASVGDAQCIHRGPFVYPHLQRIAYVDGVIYGMISEDQGETWDVLAVIDTNTWGDGKLGANVPLYVGMWVTSHEANSNDATAEFSGVTLVDGYVPMAIVKQPSAELSVEEGSIFGPSAFGVIAFGTNAKFIWYKDDQYVADEDIETYYASSKTAGTYDLTIEQGTSIMLSEKSVVSVIPSANPGKVQVWIYDSPNSGSLAAVETAFNNFRVADQVYYMTDYLEIPADRADNYGTAFVGLLTPEETGTYYFYAASDDDSDFYLSTDDTPENLVRIAGINSGDWTNSREYTKYDYQKSAAVTLEGGKSYMFAGFHNEGSGGDNFSIAWATPSTGDVVPTTPIPAKYLSQYGVPSEKDLTLSYSVEDTVTGVELVLRWAVSSGAVLEVAPTADSANWTVLEGELVDGAYQFRVKMNEIAGFYRLTR